MIPSPRHRVLDVVELVTESGRWPAGTVFVSLPQDALTPAAGGVARAASDVATRTPLVPDTASRRHLQPTGTDFSHVVTR